MKALQIFGAAIIMIVSSSSSHVGVDVGGGGVYVHALSLSLGGNSISTRHPHHHQQQQTHSKHSLLTMTNFPFLSSLTKSLLQKRSQQLPRSTRGDPSNRASISTPATAFSAHYQAVPPIFFLGGMTNSKPAVWGLVAFYIVRAVVDAVIGAMVSLQITTRLEELENSNIRNTTKALEVVDVGDDTQEATVPSSSSSSSSSSTPPSLHDQYIKCIETRTPFSSTLLKILDDEIFSKSWKAKRVRKRFIMKGLIKP
jgi:hypothetical protein